MGCTRRKTQSCLHDNCRGNNDDEWNDEGYSPSNVQGEVLILHQRVEDGGHHEVGDSSSSISPPGSKCITCSHDVLVEKSSRPYLARYKGSSEDTNEETNYVETCCTGYGTGKGTRNGADDKASCEGILGAETIACGSGN